MEKEYEPLIQFIENYWPDYDEIQEKLEQPTSELVIECYQRFRELIYKLLSQSTGQELHAPSSEIDSLFNLLRFTNNFLKNRSKQDGPDSTLTLTDLLAPTARRTKIRMKLLMNMLVFFYADINQIQSAEQKQRQLSNTISVTRQHYQPLQTELATKAENLARMEDEREKIKTKLKQVELDYHNLQEQKEDKNQNCKQLQQELKTALDTYQNKQALVKNLKINFANCNEQLVSEESCKSLEDLKQNLCMKSSELEREVNYIAECLSVKKPDTDRFSSIYKKIDLLTKDANTNRQFSKDVTTLQNEIKQLETICNKHKEIERKRESIIKIKNNTKEINLTCQSSSIQSKTVLQQIFCEIEQIIIEMNDEKVYLKKLIENEQYFQEKILEAKTFLSEEQNSIKHAEDITSAMYTRILTAENPVVTQFLTAIDNVKKSINR